MAKKYYFDNDIITQAIIKYQEDLGTGSEDISILHPYTDQIQQLVRGVINTHKIYRWWNDVDELVQEGMLAIYDSFSRFNPDKGTAFNYLSIVVKNHLKNWTQSKNRKRWATNEFNDEIYESMEQESTDERMTFDDMFFHLELKTEDLELTLEAVQDAIYKEKLYNKRDIVRFLVKQGWNKKNIDAVFKRLEDHFSYLND